MTGSSQFCFKAQKKGAGLKKVGLTSLTSQVCFTLNPQHPRPSVHQAVSAGHLQIETLQPMVRFAAPEATPATTIVLTAHQAALLKKGWDPQQESVTAVEVPIQDLNKYSCS